MAEKRTCAVCGEPAEVWVFEWFCLEHAPGIVFRQSERAWGLASEMWNSKLKKWIHAGWTYFFEN